jgi:protoporphyrinogen oxidase
VKVVIIGSGPTGLSCAKKLNGKIDYIIFEKENKIGGLAKSVEKNNFIFDYSGHLLHLRWKETTDFVFNILQNNLIKIKRNAQIYLKGYFVDYPFQINLYNLPPNIKSKCVSDFIKAYSREKKETKNFYKWALNTFGKSICNYFMFPYNEKLFSFDIKKLTINWLGNFVPKPDINLVLKGAYQQ